MKKIVDDLEPDVLGEPTQSDSDYWSQKGGTISLVVDYRGLKKQKKKLCWPLLPINSLDENIQEFKNWFSNA